MLSLRTRHGLPKSSLNPKDMLIITLIIMPLSHVALHLMFMQNICNCKFFCFFFYFFYDKLIITTSE